jgi:hypothetical protein
MRAREITAVDIAIANGLDPKRYRQALRNANLGWYQWGARWSVIEGSAEHRDMLLVLESICGSRHTAQFSSKSMIRPVVRNERDEHYIIDLCDEVLRTKALRQHSFDFLRGDKGQNGHSRCLPVDAWYPSLNLVIEYRERQHSEPVAFFDRRDTVSGMGRGAQRARYDQIRRDVLPQHFITLIELDYSAFLHKPNKRLVRCDDDRKIVAGRLSKFVL